MNINLGYIQRYEIETVTISITYSAFYNFFDAICTSLAHHSLESRKSEKWILISIIWLIPFQKNGDRRGETNPNVESNGGVVAGGRAPQRRNGVEAAMKWSNNTDSASYEMTVVLLLQRFEKRHLRHRQRRRRIHSDRNWKIKRHY